MHADEFELLDLRRCDELPPATRDVDEVYQLAADMGGIGFISAQPRHDPRNNALINMHTIEAAQPQRRRPLPLHARPPASIPITCRRRRRGPAEGGGRLPRRPEDGYGWEKLFSEKLCQYYAEEGRMQTRVARFHNIYGPLGTYDGGREKAPAAICRKVALAHDGDDDRGVGRRGADPLVLLRRRLRRGHLPAHAVRLLGAAQPRHRPR